MEQLHQVYLHLGSNQGDRQQQLEGAQALIEASIGRIGQCSAIYETAAWGITDQEDFLNMALVVESALPPEAVMQAILAIEEQMGRKRVEKWGPRVIDIDILFYDQLLINQPNLTIPHPHLQDRAFVLVPLLEIAADFYHPILQKTIEELYIECRDSLDVLLFEFSD
ncbi:MAG: 2-amino-4-hydroxy-6-hydroxymethyldihydropteridine diphosphokinase [Bacteroidota bacterium]